MNCFRFRLVCVVLVGWLASSLLAADQPLWKAGTARANITPSQPQWMAGFASRTNVLEFTTGSPPNYTTNNFATAYTSTGGGTNVLCGGAGTGTVVTVTDTGAASGTARYYRIRVLAP